MTGYLATINVPGHLPMDDDPPVFETPREAWEYLRDERMRSEDDVPEWTDHACPAPQDCEYSDTVAELDKYAQWATRGMVCDFEAVGAVYGETPGYDGDHDLGLAYSVTEVEETPLDD